MRASDSERDEAIKVLNNALTEGRLALDEHGDRIEAALEATTIEELTELTSDVHEPPPLRSQSRRSWWLYAVPLVALATMIALVLALQGEPSDKSPDTSQHVSAGAQTTAVTCAGSSGSTILSQTGPENTKVLTPQFKVSTGGCLHYTESSNCASGTMLLYIYQTGVSSVAEPSLFGCNSLTYPLTAGTYYVAVTASGHWKLFVTSG